eukprot:m.118368 g.118368  ORF g.118368 m.118368 type:complete len:137 (+) comp9228_c0_seq2:148-558(+)
MAAAYIRKHLPEMAEKFNPEATFLDLQESHLMKYSKQDLIAILQNPALAIAMYYELHPEKSSAAQLSDVCATLRRQPMSYLFLRDADLLQVSQAGAQEFAQFLGIPIENARAMQESCHSELHRRHFLDAAVQALSK